MSLLQICPGTPWQLGGRQGSRQESVSPEHLSLLMFSVRTWFEFLLSPFWVWLLSLHVSGRGAERPTLLWSRQALTASVTGRHHSPGYHIHIWARLTTSLSMALWLKTLCFMDKWVKCSRGSSWHPAPHWPAYPHPHGYSEKHCPPLSCALEPTPSCLPGTTQGLPASHRSPWEGRLFVGYVGTNSSKRTYF